MAESISINGRLVRVRQRNPPLNCFTFVLQEHTIFSITPDFAIPTDANEWHIDSAILVLLASHRFYGDTLDAIGGYTTSYESTQR